jgi:hypothetical protein
MRMSFAATRRGQLGKVLARVWETKSAQS